MNESKNIIKVKYTPMQKELIRKSIHMTIAIVPAIAAFNLGLSISLLMTGIFFYLVSEFFKYSNVEFFRLISSISAVASRDRDKGLTLGPLTLAIGSLIVLTAFSPVAAACGIYALAFGDGFSSITGKLWGKTKIPFTKGKSFIGFFTCFTMILSSSYGVTGSLNKSVIAALGGSIIELIPIKDVDNILIPIIVALIITI